MKVQAQLGLTRFQSAMLLALRSPFEKVINWLGPCSVTYLPVLMALHSGPLKVVICTGWSYVFVLLPIHYYFG
jgi:Mg2+/citrate symporter